MNILKFHRLELIKVLHWLAISIFLLNLWSGINISIDQRRISLIGESWWLGMSMPIFWHLIFAVALVTLVVMYLIYFYLRVRTTRSPIHPKSSKGLARRLLYIPIILLMLTGALQLFMSLERTANAVRMIHFCFAVFSVLLIMQHIVVEIADGGFSRVSRFLFSIRIRKFLPLICILFVVGTLILGTGFFAYTWFRSNQIEVAKVDARLEIDGDGNDLQWSNSKAKVVNTYFGFPYFRTIPVEVRMVHDGMSLYVLAKWPDPTRSVDHLPMIKMSKGWEIRQDGFFQNDENTYYEDKFAVMIGSGPFDAIRSVFLKRDQGRGGHVMPEGEIVDVWHWKSVRNQNFAKLDDSFFGPRLNTYPAQRRYTWGYSADPLLAGGFIENWRYAKPDTVEPIRLPRDPATIQRFNEESSRSLEHALHWFETMPYRTELDTYPVGTVMPSVVWIHPNEGDRGNVRAAGKWKDGYWTLEMSRNLVTDSRYDKEISNGAYFWFATFDHAQTRHTYHIQPLRLVMK
jgi:hypothetical protein